MIKLEQAAMADSFKRIWANILSFLEKDEAITYVAVAVVASAWDRLEGTHSSGKVSY